MEFIKHILTNNSKPVTTVQDDDCQKNVYNFNNALCVIGGKNNIPLNLFFWYIIVG